MNSIRLAFLASCFLAAACHKTPVTAPSSTEETQLSLKDTIVRVALSRSTLGLSADRPVSRQAGLYNGVELSISGHVVEDTEKYLVLRSLPDPHEHVRDLTWIPHSSILSIYQENSNPTSQAESSPSVGDPEPWRMEAVHNLLGMVSFPLRDLPQGKLMVWWVKDGKKDFLDEIPTTPGFDQWLCVGVDPVDRNSLFMSVISDENKGFSMTSLPTPELRPLQSTLELDHDWTKSSVIATESTGEGKLWALLKRDP